MNIVRCLALLASVALHGVAFGVAPVIVPPAPLPPPPLEDFSEEGGYAPVRVTLAEPDAIASPDEVALPDLAAGAASGPPLALAEPPPPPPAPPPVEPPAVPLLEPVAEAAQLAQAAPELIPPLPESVPPELIPLDEPEPALASAEDGPEPTAEDGGNAHERRMARVGKRAAHRHRARKTKEPAPPCEASPDIVSMDEGTWWVERGLVEYYATHRKEIAELGTVWLHKGPEGKPDGFKVGLSRCSLLRQGGLRSGDLVHDINGRRIHSVLQAVAAYFVLRNEPTLYVRVSRKGVEEPVVLAYHLDERAPIPGRAPPKEGWAVIRGR